MFGFLSALNKTAQWNSDPEQKKLASMILAAGRHEVTHGQEGAPISIREVIALTTKAGWKDKEAANRFVHAVSMIKPIADRNTYEAAKGAAERLYVAYTT